MATKTDSQGRLYLPKDVRERYGERFHIVEYEDRIELMPIADDPLAAVREAAGELREASAADVRDAAQRSARRESREDHDG